MFCKRLKKSEWTAHITIGCLFLVGLLATGCVEVVDDKAKEGAEPNTKVQAHQFTGEWADETEFHAYKGLERTANVYCWQNRGDIKMISSPGQLAPTELLGTAPECDTYFRGGAIVTYRTQNRDVTVTLPTDLVFRGEQLLTSDAPVIEITTQGRIFLESATLSSQGKDLRLVAREIIFENAALQNFHAQRTAPQGQNGLPGGTITIEALKASGQLMLDLRGQNGGQGLQGQSYGRVQRGDLKRGGTGMTGKRGGETGNVIFDVVDSSQLNTEFNFEPGREGAGGPGGIGEARIMYWQGVPVVFVQPTNGDSGLPGSPGMRGTCLEKNASRPRLCLTR